MKSIQLPPQTADQIAALSAGSPFLLHALQTVADGDEVLLFKNLSLTCAFYNLPYSCPVDAQRRADFAVAHAAFAQGEDVSTELCFIGMA